MFKQSEVPGCVIVFGQYFWVIGPTVIRAQASERFNHQLGWLICAYSDEAVGDILRNDFLLAPWDDHDAHRVDFYKEDLRNIVRVFN